MTTSSKTLSTENFYNFLTALIAGAKNNNHRYPLLLTGNKIWRHNVASKIQESFFSDPIAWISDIAPEKHMNLFNSSPENIIGKEFNIVIYDIENSFSPNLFAAISGTLHGGGLFIILCPSFSDWLDTLFLHDKFVWRIVHILSNSKDVLQVSQYNEWFNVRNQAFFSASLATRNLNQKKQQTLAVNEIVRVAKGHRNRPLVLLADRGRGKSAALGIAAAELILSGTENIIITAPSASACHVAFRHFNQALNHEFTQSNDIHINQKKLTYIAPDKLASQENTTNLLIIDEAAGIPIPLLEKYLKIYSRIVFSSTVHGYEGTGQCFSIKFFTTLNKEKPGWKKLVLELPIRWGSFDPLEKLVNKLFLFNQKEEKNRKNTPLHALTIDTIPSSKLIQNEDLLCNFYNLLSSAHYKTQPSDLKQIINDPNISIYLVRKKQSLLAAAMSIKEGEFRHELSTDIRLGHRRIKGHITPQSLLSHLNIQKAGDYKYSRIMRIAVKPELQGQGLGTLLVNKIQEDAKNNNNDFLSCSYGANLLLLDFWKKQAFSMIRIGHHKKAKTNSHAALMLKTLSTRAEPILEQAQSHFQNNFPCLLRENLNTLDADISLNLFKNFMQNDKSKKYKLYQNRLNELEPFTKHKQSYEDNIYKINSIALEIMHDENAHTQLSKEELKLILMKSIYGYTWQQISEIFYLNGKKQAMDKFRNIIFFLANSKLE